LQAENEMLANSNIHVTCRPPAETRSYWKNNAAHIYDKDPDVTRKMMSVKGVAILHRFNRDKSSDRCIIFPTFGVPRMADISGIAPIVSTCIPRGPDTRATHPTIYHKCWPDDTGHFSHSYIDGEMCNFHNMANDVGNPRLISVFESSKSKRNAPRQTRVDTTLKTSSGLIEQLLNLTQPPNTVYTQALAHMVVISALNNFIAIENKKTKRSLLKPLWKYPSDYYRLKFLCEYQRGPALTGSTLHEDYSMFKECLNLQHRQMRNEDLFSLLITQAIPFPQT